MKCLVCFGFGNACQDDVGQESQKVGESTMRRDFRRKVFGGGIKPKLEVYIMYRSGRRCPPPTRRRRQREQLESSWRAHIAMKVERMGLGLELKIKYDQVQKLSLIRYVSILSLDVDAVKNLHTDKAHDPD